jgi:hypothetical protein
VARPARWPQVVRTAYDPDSQLMFATRNAAAQAPEWQGVDTRVTPELAGPAHAETDWGTYRHDGAGPCRTRHAPGRTVRIYPGPRQRLA